MSCLKAFQDGGKQEAIELLSSVDNPHKLTNSSNTRILHWACYHGWIDILIKLINEYQFNLMYKNAKGYTSLHAACCQKDNLSVIHYLVSECQCDPKSSVMMVSLHYIRHVATDIYIYN